MTREFLLGFMIAWSPSLIVMVWSLRGAKVAAHDLVVPRDGAAMEALFEIQQMDHLEWYLKRGRRYKELSEGSISDLLAREMDQITASFGKGADWTNLDDLLAEYATRGSKEIPPGEASAAFERMIAASDAHISALSHDAVQAGGEKIEQAV